MAKTTRQNEQTVVLIGEYAHDETRSRCTIYNLEDAYTKWLHVWKGAPTAGMHQRRQWNNQYSPDQTRAITERELSYLKPETARTFPFAFLT